MVFAGDEVGDSGRGAVGCILDGVSFATNDGGGGTVVQIQLLGGLIVMLGSVDGPGVRKVMVVAQ